MPPHSSTSPKSQSATVGEQNRSLMEVFLFTLESFPHGTAQTNKIGLFARALHSRGIPVRILLLDAREDLDRPRNTDVRGLFHGIPFEYTAGRTTRAGSFLRRNWLKMWSLFVALWRMRGDGGRVAVFFVHDAGRLLLLLLACRLMRVKAVIDLCEWMPSLPAATWVNRWGYESGAVFRLTDGVIPISRLLESRVHTITGKHTVPCFYLSNLIDPVEFEHFGSAPESRPYILWAGSFDQYMDTVRFVLRAFAQLRTTHPEVLLVLCGGYSDAARTAMLAFALDLGIPLESLSMPGFVSRRTLLDYYAGARALLAPLEDDERSRARFPFKLGEYLLTGRPVVSSRVGDVPDYLHHGVNAMLAEADDPASFTACIDFLLRNPELAAQIGLAGSVVSRNRFDYRSAGVPIAAFLEQIADEDPSEPGGNPAVLDHSLKPEPLSRDR